MRLNCVDHYQAVPSELDPPLPYGINTAGKDGKPKVPVIRVFGATETGQKLCVHIHGALPYLYIEYDGSLRPEEGQYRVLPCIECVINLFIYSELHDSESASFNRSCTGCELSP